MALILLGLLACSIAANLIILIERNSIADERDAYRIALSDLLDWALEAAQQIEDEWGKHRTFAEVDAAGEMPEEILAAHDLLSPGLPWPTE